MYYRLKIAIVIVSFLLLASGIILKMAGIAIAGAFAYIVSLAFNLYEVIVLSRSYKKGGKLRNDSTWKRLNYWLQGIIVLYGLIAFFVAPPNYIRITGRLIWIATIMTFLFSGLIAK